MSERDDRTDAACQADRDWVHEAIAKVEADANRSADTHLLVFPLARRVGHRPLSEGRVDPSDRLAQAPARPLAVPVRAVQRLDPRRLPGDRGLVRLDRGLRGLLRPDARPAVRRRHARLDQQGEDRADRVLRRPLPLGRRPDAGGRRVAAAGRGDRRPLHRPVHLRRAGHRLARQQQHRRVDLRPARAANVTRCPAGSWSAPAPAAPARPSAATCATGGCRPGSCVVDPENSAFFRGWANRDPDYTTGRGSRIEGIGRPRVEPSFLPGIVDRMIQVPDAASIAATRMLARRTGHRGRRFHRDESVGRVPDHRRSARGWRPRLGGHAPLRWRRAVYGTRTTTTAGSGLRTLTWSLTKTL